MFCQQFEGSENNFKKGYFRKLIPWFVRKRINYSGLCIKHDIGIYYSKLLEKHRKDWHFYQHTCTNSYKCKINNYIVNVNQYVYVSVYFVMYVIMDQHLQLMETVMTILVQIVVLMNVH